MDAEESIELQQTAALRQEIDQTRISLARKLETLEDEVRQSVSNARTAVTDYVEETRRAFDIREHVRARPWAMFGGAIATGLIAARLSPGSSRRSKLPRYSNAAFGGRAYATDEESGGLRFASPQTGSPVNGTASRTFSSPRLVDRFSDEIDEIKAMAIGTLVAAVRDYAASRVPTSVAPQLCEVANHLTAKLGGSQITGKVFDRTG